MRLQRQTVVCNYKIFLIRLVPVEGRPLLINAAVNLLANQQPLISQTKSGNAFKCVAFKLRVNSLRKLVLPTVPKCVFY